MNSQRDSDGDDDYNVDDDNPVRGMLNHIASDLSTKIAENMYLANPSELIFL
jgi:hypothetical protein